MPFGEKRIAVEPPTRLKVNVSANETGTGVDATAVAVGGTGVAGTGVAVGGGTGVDVAGSDVAVGGTGVARAGTAVAATGVDVAGGNVAVGGMAVVSTGRGVGGSGVDVAIVRGVDVARTAVALGRVGVAVARAVGAGVKLGGTLVEAAEVSAGVRVAAGARVASGGDSAGVRAASGARVASGAGVASGDRVGATFGSDDVASATKSVAPAPLSAPTSELDPAPGVEASSSTEPATSSVALAHPVAPAEPPMALSPWFETLATGGRAPGGATSPSSTNPIPAKATAIARTAPRAHSPKKPADLTTSVWTEPQPRRHNHTLNLP